MYQLICELKDGPPLDPDEYLRWFNRIDALWESGGQNPGMTMFAFMTAWHRLVDWQVNDAYQKQRAA